MVGAGAVVVGDIPSNSVTVGNPARVICTYESFIEKNTKMMENGNVYNIHSSQKNVEDFAKMKADQMNGGIDLDI